MTTTPTDPVLCACGCGRPVPPKTAWHRQAPRYIHGHGSRDPEVKARRAATLRRFLDAGRPPIPTYICQCGCGQVIPPQRHHRTSPPRYIPGHHQRDPQGAYAASAKGRPPTQPPADWVPPSGMCECGCGKPAPLAVKSKPHLGQYAGYPQRFLHGHNSRGRKGPEAPGWKGGRRRRVDGYVQVWAPDHPEAAQNGYAQEHRVVYAESRGVGIPAGVVIHHANGVKDDNRPENLVAVTHVEHARAHQLANEIIGLFLDDRLLEAAKAHVREHGTLPDLEALTAQVYGHQ